jgi:hypothetical protein
VRRHQRLYFTRCELVAFRQFDKRHATASRKNREGMCKQIERHGREAVGASFRRQFDVEHLRSILQPDQPQLFVEAVLLPFENGCPRTVRGRYDCDWPAWRSGQNCIAAGYHGSWGYPMPLLERTAG